MILVMDFPGRSLVELRDSSYPPRAYDIPDLAQQRK